VWRGKPRSDGGNVLDAKYEKYRRWGRTGRSRPTEPERDAWMRRNPVHPGEILRDELVTTREISV